MREFLSPIPDSVAAASHWWVALSGGADSVALLYALHSARSEVDSPEITAVHVNHGLHPEADLWANLCRQHCDALGIPLVIEKIEVQPAGRGLEAAAREARYHAFERVLSTNHVLFTAHHADDMVETVLLRLFRGAGPRGLSGIPRQRSCGEGLIFRPFLEVRSDALRDAVEEAELDYVTDPSNLRIDQDRNYLRQRVIPAVEARWPGYRDTVLRAAHLQAQVQRRLMQLPLSISQTVVGEPTLTIDPEVDAELLAAQVHQWLSQSEVAMPDRRRLMEFARQALTADADRLPEIRWGESCLRAWRQQIIQVSEPPPERVLPATVVVGEPLSGEWGELLWELETADIALCEGAVLKVVASGEMPSLASPGQTRKATRKWLQEMNVPPWWRSQIPVLTDTNGSLWVLSAGPLEGIAAHCQGCEGRALRPVWRPFLTL